MRAQVVLTVPEAKQLIAMAVAGMPVVQQALATGKILLKGGTTVSAVMEQLTGRCLRISGRVSPCGTKAAAMDDGEPHSVLIKAGAVEDIDEGFADAVAILSREDIVIIGANALDASGRAAMMLGRSLGGKPGQGFAGIMSQGCRVIIACGLEKLIPGSIDEAVRAAGITAVDWSMGMAVGLAPLVGEVVTEQRALEMIAGVRCCVAGRGGIQGAEGASVLIAEGTAAEVEKAVQAVLTVKEAKNSGTPASLTECAPGSASCGGHHACAWRTARGGKLYWHVK